MIQDNQKRHLTSTLSMFMLAVFVIIATFAYAYFTADTKIGNNLTIYASVSDEITPVMTAYTLDDLNVSVSTADMLETGSDDDNPVVADSDNQTLFISLLGGSEATGSSCTCTYDLYWENLGETYTPSSGLTAEQKEFTLKIKNSSGAYILNETRVDTLQQGLNDANQYIVATGQSITSYGTLVEERLIVTVSIYNLNFAQTIDNKSFSSRVGITNVNC